MKILEVSNVDTVLDDEELQCLLESEIHLEEDLREALEVEHKRRVDQVEKQKQELADLENFIDKSRKAKWRVEKKKLSYQKVELQRVEKAR